MVLEAIGEPAACLAGRRGGVLLIDVSRSFERAKVSGMYFLLQIYG